MPITKRLLKPFLLIAIFTALSSCGGDSSDGEKTNADTSPPVISLNGVNPVTLVQGDIYSEPGASAIDDFDGVVEVTVSGNVDTTKLGVYIIEYSANDSAGNTSSITRTVNVIASDNVAPVITLIGDNPQTIQIGTNYVEAGATAVDAVDGPVDVTVSGMVNPLFAGSYTITYSAVDSSNNQASVDRTVIVVSNDTTPPTITLKGASTIILPQGADYNEPGALAKDDVDPVVIINISGTVDVNTIGDYTVTYTATDKSNNTASITRTVSVVESRPFITKWQTDKPGYTTANELMIYAATSSLDFNIDWGDGSNDQHVTRTIIHTYAAPGIYTITMSGYLPYFQAGGDRNKLISVEQWGSNAWLSMLRAFDYCGKVVINATDVPNLTQATSLEGMFSNSGFNSDISNWDVSTITNMSAMFSGAGLFNQDISSWNVSAVTDMTAMFWGAASFNQNIGTWDVSSVTSMRGMFRDANTFNQPIGGWDVSSVTNMDGMFRNAVSFDQDLSAWQVGAVSNTAEMFYGANVFNRNLNNWDVSSVTTMNGMFAHTGSFNQDLASWNVSSVTDMSHMFESALAFNRIIDAWDVSAVTTMAYMFHYASLFDQPLNSWNVSAVTDMSYMFYGVDAFNQSLNNWNVSSVNSMNAMFAYAPLFNQPIGSWDVSAVSNMGGMFYAAKAFDQDIGGWNVSSVTNMGSMFLNAESFNQNIGAWDVSAVTNMSAMFSYALLFNQDISSWDVSAVTSMGSMFNQAKAFNQDIGQWNVSSVTNMAFMFSGTQLFNYDLSGWDVSSVTEMGAMFTGAGAFDQNLGSWNVSSVTNMAGMFDYVVLSVANYDAILTGWSTQPLQSNVKFGAGTNLYSNAGAAARDVLINTYNWVITDGGLGIFP